MRNRHVRKSRSFRKAPEACGQLQLLPPSLDDLVPAGHMTRGLKEVLNSLDISGLEELYDDKGGYPYAPRALLGILLYAYMDGERSSRRIEEHCRYDVRYRYIGGGYEPDDRTISRFRRRLEGVLPELFQQILGLLRQKGLVKMQVIAVDGTKVAGSVSQWKRVFEEADYADLADSDARQVRSRKGHFILGYNAQAAVDAGSGVVVATYVGNVSGDSRELPKVVDKIQGKVESVVADKGYDSAENAQFLESRQITAYLNPTRQGQDFWKLDTDGKARCPAGHALEVRDHFARRDVQTVRLFIRHCPTCPTKCHLGRYKYLSHPQACDPLARIRNAHRCNTPEGRAILRLRGPSVEGVFGQLKWNHGFQRFRLRGLSAVSAEFEFECTVHNLRKLLRSYFRLLSPHKLPNHALCYGW